MATNKTEWPRLDQLTIIKTLVAGEYKSRKIFMWMEKHVLIFKKWAKEVLYTPTSSLINSLLYGNTLILL